MFGFAVGSVITACGGGAEGTAAPAVSKNPNILYIMADDLGYSDVHALGGEIETPNLDALVANGRILTNHHSGTVSAITRSMLISGTDHHLVGEGTMGAPSDERKGLPGYEGYLNDRSLSVAQLLKDGGYHTYIAGKWHIGSGVVGSASTSGQTPDQWGFERSYTLLGGAATNHFAHEPAGSKNYTENGVYVQPGQPGQPGGSGGSPTAFYSTDFYTQKLIQYIDSNHGDGKPFFAYAAFTSPHWPLQVPEPWLSKYKGKYDGGYEPIRAARIARMQGLGILPATLTINPGLPDTLTASAASANYAKPSAKYINALNRPADGYVDYRAGVVNKKWSSLSAEEKKSQARYMEIYAGMVSNLDHNIGLLIQHLKDIGEYDNTFIMFQSDNGAEGAASGSATDVAYAAPGVYELLGTDNGLQTASPYVRYGSRWAEVGASPFAQWKSFLGEGGVSTPAIVHLPGQVGALPKLEAFTHVTDNTATFVALARVTSPAEAAPPLIDPATQLDKNKGKVIYNSRYVYPITGKSLLPWLKGTSNGLVHTEPFGDESYGRAYLFSADGKWKARWTEPPVGPADGHWELFSILDDRGETNDLAATYPALSQDLFLQWQNYMAKVGGVAALQPGR
jgi:arylsulfatase